jgi:hypothetical protein
MKEIILHLPDKTYELLRAEATSARMSLEQWSVEEISIKPRHRRDTWINPNWSGLRGSFGA